jgi:hypothetical protein
MRAVGCPPSIGQACSDAKPFAPNSTARPMQAAGNRASINNAPWIDSRKSESQDAGGTRQSEERRLGSGTGKLQPIVYDMDAEGKVNHPLARVSS